MIENGLGYVHFTSTKDGPQWAALTLTLTREGWLSEPPLPGVVEFLDAACSPLDYADLPDGGGNLAVIDAARILGGRPVLPTPRAGEPGRLP